MWDPERKWTRRALLEAGTARLSAAGVEEARRNVEWMLEDLLGTRTALLLAYPDREVAPETAAAFERMLVRRMQHEPVQYILGHADFFGLRLRVSPDVLIPRPETEQVVEAALERIALWDAPRVLDGGTGSGCIALAVKQARPDARVVACDVSEAALALATESAEAYGLAVTFTRADVLAGDFADCFPAPFDLVISNPPYIPAREAGTLAAEVREFEPHLALFAGDDPCLFYRALARHARALLDAEGWMVVETHADHAREAYDLFAEAGLTAVEVRRDLAGHPRIVSARCPAGPGRNDARPETR
jgi:release factor glutamine methyltransferase